MAGIQHYASFIGAVLLFQLIPGPGTVAILSASARYGVAAGMATVLGTLAGDFCYMLAAILGLASLLAAWPGVFSTLQWIGIAYLVWLGLKLLRAQSVAAEEGIKKQSGNWSHVRTGLAVCLTNPKAIMFFMAFFPLFLDVRADTQTLAILVAHVSVICLIYETMLVIVGNALAKHLSRIPAIRWIATRLAGVALIGFGLRLALDRR